MDHHRHPGRAAHASEEAWLVVEPRASGEHKSINLATTRVCEQADQQLKEELGRPLRRPLMASSSRFDDMMRTPICKPGVSDPIGGKRIPKARRSDVAGDRRAVIAILAFALPKPTLQANASQIARINLPK